MILLLVVVFIYIVGIFKISEALYIIEKLEEELKKEIDDGK